MKNTVTLIIYCASLAIAGAGQTNGQPEVKPLTVDLTVKVKDPSPTPLGQGSATSPEGTSLIADSRSFFINEKPWIPIAGELQNSRYPAEEWREALLKMKAGGLDIVSTYVFWIHQEEIEGKFDWSGQRSLRDFLETAKEVGIKVIVRMGPYANGECRNGGLPNWLVNKDLKTRSIDPEFLSYVKILYREIAAQMKGLLWKDGGPVIGIQVDNESADGDYLLELKKMAREEGVDVPFYTITGWQGGVPEEGLLPLFGGYADGFWGGTPDKYRKEFLFNSVRSMNDLGAHLDDIQPSTTELLERFPYACAEVGGGMLSCFSKRIKISPDWISALALSKLGSGNNLPGYYMYHGGIHPDGRLSSLQYEPDLRRKRKAIFLENKNYDFQAPLGNCGQVRRHYHLLRMQHLFLQDFGATLARMPTYFPDVKPRNITDFDTVRWAVRGDAQGRGFLFFNNEQPYEPLPAHKNIRFEIKTSSGSMVVPDQPITIPSGAYGIFPLKLDMQGLLLDYATVQPLCHVAGEDGSEVYFFSAIPGIRAELKFHGETPLEVTPGSGVAARKTTPGGKQVSFVVLTKEQGEALYRLPFAGRERVFLSDGALYADKTNLKLQGPLSSSLSVFPPIPSIRVGGTTLSSTIDGVFSRFSLPTPPPDSPDSARVTASLKKAAIPLAGPAYMGGLEAIWGSAAEYQIDIPKSVSDRHAILDIHYKGDSARLYVGDKLFMDNCSNGDPMSIALWRIPKEDLNKISLRILPPIENPPVSTTEVSALKVMDLETTTISPEPISGATEAAGDRRQAGGPAARSGPTIAPTCPAYPASSKSVPPSAAS